MVANTLPISWRDHCRNSGFHWSIRPRFLSERKRPRSSEEIPGRDKAPTVVIHPGSGSETKNWPIENWIALGEHVQRAGCGSRCSGGEADEKQIRSCARCGRTNRRCDSRSIFHYHISQRSWRCCLRGSRQRHFASRRGFGREIHFAFWSNRSRGLGAGDRELKVLWAPDGDLRKLPVAEVLTVLGHPGEARDQRAIPLVVIGGRLASL